MTLMEFVGCTFIAFGPAFGLFVFTIARDPLRVIVLITSGFFWLLALLLSSIWWYAVVPLREKLAFGLVFSVIFQELFRFLFYKLLRKADEGLQRVSLQGQDQNDPPKDISNKHIMAYVSGLGFGVVAGAFSLINVLADMVGPGTIGIHGDSKYFFLVSAFLTMAFIFLHTFWGVIFFDAMDKKVYWKASIVIITHMLVSCLTLLNSPSNPTYLGSLIPAYLVMFAMGGLAFKDAGGSLVNIKAALAFKSTGHYSVD